jgi:legumain
MSQKQLYGKLTIYIEACESGSMFSGLLPNNTELYGVTAANPSESSWATYCSPQDVVNGKEIGRCLGDLFSLNWMEDSESSNLNTVRHRSSSARSASTATSISSLRRSRGLLRERDHIFEEREQLPTCPLQQSRPEAALLDEPLQEGLDMGDSL